MIEIKKEFVFDILDEEDIYSVKEFKELYDDDCMLPYDGSISVLVKLDNKLYHTNIKNKEFNGVGETFDQLCNHTDYEFMIAFFGN